MRILFTTVLLTISLTVFGQKKSLLGKYTHSHRWYEYFLTLGDSGKFIIEENTDSGFKKTTGSWTINGRLIKLIPTKCISNWGDEQAYELPLSYLAKESFILVDNKNNLTKLAPKNQPDSTYKIPDYKLTKISKVR